MTWLTTREWAVIVWLVVLAAWLGTKPDLRRSIGAVVGAVMAWKVVVSIAALVAWVLGLVYVASLVGLWNTGLIKDTVFWLMAYSFVSLSGALDAAKQDHWFRKAALGAVGLAAFMQFFLNLYTFPLLVELVLQPLVAVLAMASVYAHHHEEYRAAGRVIDVTMGILGALILAWTVLRLVQTWDSIDRGQTLLGFAFSLWLPLAVLPFLYVFALVMAYEILFMRLRWKRNGVEPGWPVRLAIFSTLTGRLRAINDLPRHARDLHDVSHAPDYRQARGLLRSYLRQRGEGEGARATASGSGR